MIFCDNQNQCVKSFCAADENSLLTARPLQHTLANHIYAPDVCEFTDAHAQLTIRHLIGLEESLGVKGESETLTSSLGPQRQLEQKRKRKTEESEEEKERERERY